MRLTLDSSETLEEALRVVGALYGVTLTVTSSTAETSAATPKGTARPRRPAAGKPRKRSAGARSSARRPRQRSGVAAERASNNADIRAWARATGLAVNNRGKVPAAVITAYRDAHK